ncbi:MAG: hypothetical protein IT539_10265 [Bradyrhizobiaceae bacterium]|nr:hypothetical protein [Bradyrhizobiaceae bacterium]
MPRRRRAGMYAILPAAIFLCVAPVGGHAETADVADVAADDVLNLRTEPRANAPLAGALPPTASGVEVLRRSEGWAYVRFGRQTGWAAARFLRPSITFSGGRPPSPLQCIGTEPFWSFSIDGSQSTFRTLETEPVAAEIGKIEPSRNSTIVWLVRPDSGPVRSAVIEARQACSDNMSDRVFPFRISIETQDGQLLSGCCDIRP